MMEEEGIMRTEPDNWSGHKVLRPYEAPRVGRVSLDTGRVLELCMAGSGETGHAAGGCPSVGQYSCSTAT